MVITIIVLALVAGIAIAALGFAELKRKELVETDKQLRDRLIEVEDLRIENMQLRSSNHNLRSSNHNHVTTIEMLLNKTEGSI